MPASTSKKKSTHTRASFSLYIRSDKVRFNMANIKHSSKMADSCWMVAKGGNLPEWEEHRTRT
jgi:hypothetical protein